MNKIFNPNPQGAQSPFRFNLIAIMRGFLLLITVGLSSVYANSTYAQTKMDINVNNVELEDLFKEIQDNSEFIFFYKDDLIKDTSKVTINLKKATLSNILDIAFANTGLSYKIDDRQVVIKKEPKTVIIQGSNPEASILPMQSTVTGTVIDANGTPLPGANVVVKGTTNGTQTDFDGNYTINVDSDAVLVFSYIGFATQEITVGGQSTINVSLAEDASQLSEVVVLGYSTQTRGDLTGSVASVDLSEAVKAPITNAAEALQGRVSGVSVISSGSPGGSPIVRVRGFGTSNSNAPLYIIDGVQTTDSSILNNINPSDILQMNVLKDGAASIYGARASNGVIIIATKNGGYNMTEPSISLDLYTGFSSASNVPDLLNAQQHGDMIFASLANDGATLTHPQYGNGPTAVVPSTLLGAPTEVAIQPGGTKWFDEIFRNGVTQNATLSMENGTAGGKYAASISYLNRQGSQIKTFFKRGAIRLNSEFKVTDKVKIGQHLNASFSNRSIGNQTNLGSNPVGLAYRNSPLASVRANDGSFAGNYANSLGLANPTNPVADLHRASDDYNKDFRVLGDIYASWEMIDGLTVKTSIGGDIQDFNNRTFLPKNPEHSEARGDNTLTEQDFDAYNWTWTNTLNYVKTFDKHSINALLGIEALETRNKGKQLTLTGFLFENPEFYLLNTGTGTPNVTFARDVSNSLSSVFGSLNYSYDSKYFLTATLRNDKSSNFLADNSSQTFPAFSAGWLLSEENFFNTSGLVNRLKLKGSWGQLGNQNVPGSNPTVNVSLLSLALANYDFSGGGGQSTGIILSSVGNGDLKWETSESTNLGFELGLLDNALNLSFEWFKITTKDLISPNNQLISTTAIDATAPFVNLGNVENKGFDISLGYQGGNESDFTYGIDVNVSAYKNEVTDLVGDFQIGNTGFRGGAITRTQVGQPISSFYGRVVDGIFASEAEVSAAPDQGFENLADGIGRFRYKDVNNDGVISDSDRDFIGSPHPDFTYGINLSAGYKNWDISAFLSGSQGNEVYNYTKIFSDFPTFFNGNRSARVLNSWTPTNTNASLPALSQSITNNETSPNSYFVEDASYLRLKNLQIGYNLPSSLLDKIGISNARFYFQATNLFTITGYDGLDPEVQPLVNSNVGGNGNGIGSTDNLTVGVDFGSYPLSRIFTFGTNLKF